MIGNGQQGDGIAFGFAGRAKALFRFGLFKFSCVMVFVGHFPSKTAFLISRLFLSISIPL